MTKEANETQVDEQFEKVIGAGGLVSRYIKPRDLTEALLGKFVRIDQNEIGPTYILENDAGELLGLNGCKALNDVMPSIEVGSRVKIVSNGVKLTKAGKDFIDLEIFKAS